MMRSMPGSDLAPALIEILEVTPLLDRREELKLASRTEAGDSGARQRLVQADLRLVVQVARKYNHRGVELTDVVPDGTVGLIEAVDRFDASRGFRLSTLATICIRDSIIDGFARGHFIRLPPRHSRQLGLVRRTADELRQRCSRQPTADELAAETGIDDARRRRLTTPSSESVMRRPRGASAGAIARHQPSTARLPNTLARSVSRPARANSGRSRAAAPNRSSRRGDRPRYGGGRTPMC
jgi:RNA polymerase sigma factor (sigma-70 family)